MGLLSRNLRITGSEDTVQWGIDEKGASISPMGKSFGPHIRLTGTVARIRGLHVRVSGFVQGLSSRALLRLCGGCCCVGAAVEGRPPNPTHEQGGSKAEGQGSKQ